MRRSSADRRTQLALAAGLQGRRIGQTEVGSTLLVCRQKEDCNLDRRSKIFCFFTTFAKARRTVYRSDPHQQCRSTLPSRHWRLWGLRLIPFYLRESSQASQTRPGYTDSAGSQGIKAEVQCNRHGDTQVRRLVKEDLDCTSFILPVMTLSSDFPLLWMLELDSILPATRFTCSSMVSPCPSNDSSLHPRLSVICLRLENLV